MDRAEVLEAYRPIRAGIQRVLRLAATACNRADLTRAVKQVVPWADIDALVKGEVPEMVTDVALFEPNQRGRRAYDRFLEEKAGQLSAPDRALAQAMARAWFSIFRVAGRHEAAGLWLEDLLDADRRLWLMDKGLEASAEDGTVLAMRLFDAGPFHAGFGIVAVPDETTTHFAVAARQRGNPLPFRQSLAATLYGDELRAEQPLESLDPAVLEALEEFAAAALRKSRARPPRKAGRRRGAGSGRKPQP
ncbi:hypothetical protein [Rhodopila globiformis]|uniref:Uncharacterized protein n=1 Tax=Rhodopila globiformis TaxID=1071 RepID=A0A2S6NKK0_RHOGL|nr:hypothetical protein [Rhodopila globiformis]PPQ35595.1 hypothetical protein CCS01_06910 [Rhodopila globiformis]